MHASVDTVVPPIPLPPTTSSRSPVSLRPLTLGHDQRTAPAQTGRASAAGQPLRLPVLPRPRGPLTEWLSAFLPRRPAGLVADDAQFRHWVAAVSGDATEDEDVQLALHVIYE